MIIKCLQLQVLPFRIIMSIMMSVAVAFRGMLTSLYTGCRPFTMKMI